MPKRRGLDNFPAVYLFLALDGSLRRQRLALRVAQPARSDNLGELVLAAETSVDVRHGPRDPPRTKRVAIRGVRRSAAARRAPVLPRPVGCVHPATRKRRQNSTAAARNPAVYSLLGRAARPRHLVRQRARVGLSTIGNAQRRGRARRMKKGGLDRRDLPSFGLRVLTDYDVALTAATRRSTAWLPAAGRTTCCRPRWRPAR